MAPSSPLSPQRSRSSVHHAAAGPSGNVVKNVVMFLGSAIVSAGLLVLLDPAEWNEASNALVPLAPAASAVAVGVALYQAGRCWWRLGRPTKLSFSSVPALNLLPVSVAFQLSPGAQFVGAGATILVSWLTRTTAEYRRAESAELVNDPELTARLQRLAVAVGTQVPEIRVQRSLTANPSTLAWAGGFYRERIVLTQGILTRLDPDEADAIIAHELGHFRNRTVWVLPVVYSLAGAGAALLAHVISPWRALAVGLLFAVGLRRLLMNPAELDCDAQAARAAGPEAAVAALDKIHRVHGLNQQGTAADWARAMGTHPPVVVRRASIERRFERPLTVDTPEVTAHRARVVFVMVAWLVAMFATAIGPVPTWVALGFGLLASLVPFASQIWIVRIVVWRQLRRQLAKTPLYAVWATLAAGALLMVLTALTLGGDRCRAPCSCSLLWPRSGSFEKNMRKIVRSFTKRSSRRSTEETSHESPS